MQTIRINEVEITPAAIAAECIGRVRDVLQLLQDKARHNKRAADESCLDDIGNSPVDNRAGVN